MRRWARIPTCSPISSAACSKTAPTLPSCIRSSTRPSRPTDVTRAVDAAAKAQTGWERTPVAIRADMLIKAADLYEQNAMEFFALCAREAGKTLADGVAEVREAVDFLRYYAGQAAGAEH